MAQNPQHHGPWRKIFQNEQTNAIRSCFVVLMVMKNNDKRSFQVFLFGTPLEAFGSCLSGVLVGTRPVFPIATSILKKEGCHTQKTVVLVSIRQFFQSPNKKFMKCRWFSSGQMQKTKWTPNLTLTKNTHWFGETAIFMSHDLESFNWNDHYNSWIFIGWHGRHPAPVDKLIPLFTRLLLWKKVKIPRVQSSMSRIWDLSLHGLQPEPRCEADKNSTTASRFSKREELRVQMGNDSLAGHFFPQKGFPHSRTPTQTMEDYKGNQWKPCCGVWSPQKG